MIPVARSTGARDGDLAPFACPNLCPETARVSSHRGGNRIGRLLLQHPHDAPDSQGRHLVTELAEQADDRRLPRPLVEFVADDTRLRNRAGTGWNDEPRILVGSDYGTSEGSKLR